MDLDLFDAFEGKTLQGAKSSAAREPPEISSSDRPPKKARLEPSEPKEEKIPDTQTPDMSVPVFTEQKTATTEAGTLTTV